MIYTVKITDEAEKDIRLLCRYIAGELENPSSPAATSSLSTEKVGCSTGG